MILGTYKFKKIEKGTYAALYKGPVDTNFRNLCWIDKEEEGWFILLTTQKKLGPFKTRKRAVDAYLAYSLDPLVAAINQETCAKWVAMPRNTHRVLTVTPEVANKVYDIIVRNCLGKEPTHDRASFVDWLTQEKNGNEYRFCGWLGFGGKFYRTWDRWYVDQYPEDEIPESRMMASLANRELLDLYTETFKAA
jgi:hypothetical protein